MDLTERGEIVSYVFEYFKKQYGIHTLIGKRESLDGGGGKTNVREILVPCPCPLEGITIDVYFYEIPCARAHVPHEDSWAASNVRSDSKCVAQKITNQFVLGRPLNGNCVGHEEVIQPPHPVMPGEPLPHTALTAHNGFAARARTAMDAAEI